MKKASISELKNQLSAYLQAVRAGETVLILDRNKPIARIERVADEGPSDRLAQLLRSGVLTPPSAPMPMSLLRQDAVRAPRSILAALLEEREEGP